MTTVARMTDYARAEVHTSMNPDSSQDAFERVLARLRDRGCKYWLRGSDSVRANCPAHRDAKPSLVVTRDDGRVLLRCFAGCQQRQVVRALGLTYADLFDVRAERVKPEIVASYGYTDLDGVVIAEKVRFKPKAFRWRTPDGKWGLNGRSVSLYNLGDLVEAKQVLLLEGERAVEDVRSKGFTATCPPGGAGHWHDTYAERLWQLGVTEVVVLPDADQPGRRHAERVAQSCYGRAAAPQSDDPDQSGPWTAWPSGRATDADLAPLRVKLVHLPDLHAGEHVVDYLQQHSATALRTLIAEAPYWYPGCDDERRRDRRRQLTRERVQRYRERNRQARNAANVRTEHPIRCNAANVRRIEREPVTRNAVTQGERSSVFITDDCYYREGRAA